MESLNSSNPRVKRELEKAIEKELQEQHSPAAEEAAATAPVVVSRSEGPRRAEELLLGLTLPTEGPTGPPLQAPTVCLRFLDALFGLTFLTCRVKVAEDVRQTTKVKAAEETVLLQLFLCRCDCKILLQAAACRGSGRQGMMTWLAK